MKLQRFDGGLNTRLAAELIASNEALVCENVDLSTGQLKSSKTLAIASSVAVNKPYYFESNDEYLPSADLRDYLSYQGNIFYSDGAIPQKRRGVTWHRLGIVEPSACTTTYHNRGYGAPATVLGGVAIAPVGIIPGLTGTFKYRYTRFNLVDGDESQSNALAEVVILLADQHASITLPATGTGHSHWRIYRVGGAALNGILVGSVAVGTTTFVDSNADISNAIPEYWRHGTLQYVYTYYNSEDGTESLPSPVSAELVTDNYLTQVYITVQASSDPQVTNIRVYRVGGTKSNFTFHSERDNVSTSFYDPTSDRALGSTALTSELNSAAPTGLQYLTESNGSFFGAVGSKLHFTPSGGNPNYWPAVYTIDFHSTIRGIANGPTGPVIFTDYETYGLSGSSATTYVKYHISQDQGCISHKSVTAQGGQLLFMSTDGLCVFNGGNVTVVSKFKLGKQTFNPVIAVMYDETYYCQLADTSVLAFDLRYTPAIYKYNLGTYWLVVRQDVLMAQVADLGTDLVQFQEPTEALTTYTYMTGNLTEGSVSSIKTYNTLHMYCKGDHTIDVYINDVLVATKTVTGVTKPIEIKIPQKQQRGSSIRFGLTGIGTVLELKYGVAGGENG